MLAPPAFVAASHRRALVDPRTCARPRAASPPVAAIVPVAGSITFGGVCGFGSGYFMKKLGRVAAVTTGAIFCLFQLAALKGYVQVNWGVVEDDVMGLLDLNKDGVVDKEDARYALENAASHVSRNMAVAGTGFASGFFMGWRQG